MRAVYLPIVLVFISNAFAEQQSTTIRIATYNLNCGNQRHREVADSITTSNAVVVFLQETTPKSERYLRTRLKESYPSFHAAGHRGRYREERFAFASKTPLTQLKFYAPVDGLFGFYSATCSVAGVDVQLINVHLSPFIIRRSDGYAAALSALQDTEKRHLQEIAYIAGRTDLSRPTIIAGDFNSLSTFKAPAQLKAMGLVDSFAAVYEDADSHPTWRWRSRPVPLELRIDYIFHTPHFGTIRSRIMKQTGSDHSLVVSELKLVKRSDSARSTLPKPTMEKSSSLVR